MPVRMSMIGWNTVQTRGSAAVVAGGRLRSTHSIGCSSMVVLRSTLPRSRGGPRLREAWAKDSKNR
jgi:hypothetical protein